MHFIYYYYYTPAIEVGALSKAAECPSVHLSLVPSSKLCILEL